MRGASISTVIIGRNDDYEPDWSQRLQEVIAYNRESAGRRGIDLRFVFVEWNPPHDRPLLGPVLTDANADTCAVVVDPAIHASLSVSDDMPIVLSMAVNAGIRAADGDFVLVTGGDVFFGTDVPDRIATHGLEPGVLYRAERVNIRPDLPWGSLTASSIEDPERVESVDTCTEPPYDAPPFTNASGDFLMADRASMLALRGFDERVHHGRLHLDSRFALNAMHICTRAELLGRIFHISHARSWVNHAMPTYAGTRINPHREVPYLNGDDWGLGAMRWSPSGSGGRVWNVSFGTGGLPDVPDSLRSHVERSRKQLEDACARRQPPQPGPDDTVTATAIDVDAFEVLPHWQGAARQATESGLRIVTPSAAWAYSAIAEVRGPEGKSLWAWCAVEVVVEQGRAAIGILLDDQLVDEQYVEPRDGQCKVFLRLPARRPAYVLIRNGEAEAASQLIVSQLQVVVRGQSRH